MINKNDITAANHYLAEFSNLLRESLVNNEKEMVPLNTELKILDTYLKLEQLRFHFKYILSINETIDKNATELPSLLLQPLVENAIKHGVALLNEDGLIQLSFTVMKKDLLISISDNGNGFDIGSTSIKGLGLKLTKDRIELLNKTLPDHTIQLTIESARNTGTTVHLTFKNWL